MSQDDQGKLRIYLGNAAGVGKTYDMLCEGHRRAERGADVVVGFVETHGRKHTAELVEGLEVVPRGLAHRRKSQGPESAGGRPGTPAGEG
jgi:two-component system, OmpR family, sensor histidine kinase KdpD